MTDKTIGNSLPPNNTSTTTTTNTSNWAAHVGQANHNNNNTNKYIGRSHDRDSNLEYVPITTPRGSRTPKRRRKNRNNDNLITNNSFRNAGNFENTHAWANSWGWDFHSSLKFSRLILHEEFQEKDDKCYFCMTHPSENSTTGTAEHSMIDCRRLSILNPTLATTIKQYQSRGQPQQITNLLLQEGLTKDSYDQLVSKFYHNYFKTNIIWCPCCFKFDHLLIHCPTQMGDKVRQVAKDHFVKKELIPHEHQHNENCQHDHFISHMDHHMRERAEAYELHYDEIEDNKIDDEFPIQPTS